MSSKRELQVDYSADVDALVIRLSDEPPEYAEEMESGVILHYSKDSKPVEIEILDASRLIHSSIGAIIRTARTRTPPQATTR